MELAMTINGSSTSLIKRAPALAIPYISVVTLASVLGTLGNLLIIGTHTTSAQHGSTVGKIFIVNLACSDLIVTALINPVAVAGAVVGPSLFETGGRQWLCTLLASICIISCVVSLLSVGCISVNRYVYICRHTAYRRLFSDRTCYMVAGATWVVGVVFDLPNHIGWSLPHTFDRKTQKCLWDRTTSHHYTVFFVTVGMLVPFTVILICYWRIFAYIRAAKLRILRSQSCSLGILATRAAVLKTVRQIKVIFFIFIAFSVCWAPYIGVLLYDELDVFPLSIHLYASMIAHLHASINFLIYGLINNGLRAEYRQFIVHHLCSHCYSVDHVARPENQSLDDFRDQSKSHVTGQRVNGLGAPRRTAMGDKPTLLALNNVPIRWNTL